MIIVSNCTETCGWAAGLIAALSFGSFGVLVKGKASTKCDIHPLVMQTYKCTICFLTSWLVLLVGEPLRFSLWGIVSGLFWVPGSIAGIFAIRNAGLAVSVGMWSALNVISSLIWGIFIFEESVKNKLSTCCGAMVLISGLVGMSLSSKPKSLSPKSKVEKNNFEDNTEVKAAISGESEDEALIKDPKPRAEKVKLRSKITHRGSSFDTLSNIGKSVRKISLVNNNLRSISSEEKDQLNQVEEGREKDHKLSPDGDETKHSNKNDKSDKDTILIMDRWVVSRWNLGLTGAIINGTWGSTYMIPMHYAKAEGISGAGFLLSFGCGSMLVTIYMWFLLYLFHSARLHGKFQKAYQSMPSLHLRQMALPGFLSGILYSLGNFCSIIAISHLGQGVGFSFVQLSMLVSGLWGIFYFEEITEKDQILNWLISALVAISGILWLSFEHNGSITH